MCLLLKDQKVNCFWQNRLAFIRDAYLAHVLSQTRDKSAGVSTGVLDEDFTFLIFSSVTPVRGLVFMPVKQQKVCWIILDLLT